MSGKLVIRYAEGTGSKVYEADAVTDFDVVNGVLYFKIAGKLNGFSLANVISFSID